MRTFKRHGCHKLSEISGTAGAQNLEKPRTVFAGFTAACKRLSVSICLTTYGMCYKN